MYDPSTAHMCIVADQVYYVLDGGALIHKDPRTKNKTYCDIFERHVN